MRLKCAPWLQQKTQLLTYTKSAGSLDEMDLEEPSYSTEHLGLVGVRTEVRKKKAENLLFPYVKGTKHPRALVFLGVKSLLPMRWMCTLTQCQEFIHQCPIPIQTSPLPSKSQPASPAYKFVNFLSALHTLALYNLGSSLHMAPSAWE